MRRSNKNTSSVTPMSIESALKPHPSVTPVPTTPASPKRQRFWRDEDGAMIIFGLMIFGMMLAIGGLSFDLIRYETHRERLQATLDRAVLAAASLTQNANPKAVVMDYLNKAGMSQYINLSDIHVTKALNSRTVEAVARIHVPLHHGTFKVFSGSGNPNNVLVAQAHSKARESIGKVEISRDMPKSW